MEVERSKIIALLNNTRALISKIYHYNIGRDKDETFFYLDRVGVELKLLYCDIREIILSDALLRQKFMEETILVNSKDICKNSTILD